MRQTPGPGADRRSHSEGEGVRGLAPLKGVPAVEGPAGVRTREKGGQCRDSAEVHEAEDSCEGGALQDGVQGDGGADIAIRQKVVQEEAPDDDSHTGSSKAGQSQEKSRQVSQHNEGLIQTS